MSEGNKESIIRNLTFVYHTPMNILQICSRIPFPLNDGGNIATYNVTAFLQTFGHKVTMAALNTSKHYQNHDHVVGDGGD